MRLKRLLKHSLAWRPSYTAAFDDACLRRIAQAVKHSEAQHSAQICVLTEHVLPRSYLHRNAPVRERAVMLFGKNRIWDTENNSGVLIYINFVEHAIEIVADRGLNSIPQAQWASWVGQHKSAFQAGQYAQGIVDLIAEMTPALLAAAPRSSGQPVLNAHADEPIRL